MWIQILKNYGVLFIMNMMYLTTSIYMEFHIDIAYIYINI